MKTQAELQKEYQSHDCNQFGHVWIEPDSGLLFARHNKRFPGKVSVFCRYCGKTAELEGQSPNVAPPPDTERVNIYAKLPEFQKMQAVAKESLAAQATIGPDMTVANQA